MIKLYLIFLTELFVELNIDHLIPSLQAMFSVFFSSAKYIVKIY